MQIMTMQHTKIVTKASLAIGTFYQCCVSKMDNFVKRIMSLDTEFRLFMHDQINIRTEIGNHSIVI